MPRVVLLTPFIRHYAGSVFDLDDATGVSGWDPDDRVREKQYFSDKRTYHLPDGGNGIEAALPVSDTVICPPEIFQGMDLHRGPCRVTAAHTGTGPNMNPADIPASIRLSKDHTTLVSGNGVEKQAVEAALSPGSPEPLSLELWDRLTERLIYSKQHSVLQLTADLSLLPPGFYQIRIQCRGDLRHEISVLKCFPLVVNYDPRTGRFKTMQTIW